MPTSESSDDEARRSVRLSDLGSGELATRAFAVPTRPQRFRRPTDIVLLVLSLVVLVLTSVTADDNGTFESSLTNWLGSLPTLLDFFWNAAFDFVQIWVIVIGLLALARQRWGLLRDWAVGLAVAVAGVLVVGRLVTGDLPSLTDGIGAADSPGSFPSLALAAGAAAIAVANPYFVSPIRTFNRWLLGVAWIGALALGVTLPGDGICALAIGWTAGALVHLVFGSPDGTPSLSDLGQSLRSIGVDAQVTSVEVKSGVAVARAHTPDGTELDIHVHGRDSWDSQFFVKMWRLLFYRSGGRNVTVNRRHQVEHQAYMTLFAQREGVLVTPLVIAATDRRGDALFVAERVGPSLGQDGAEIDDELVAGCWKSLAVLHEAGIRHGGITPAHLRVDADGVHLGEFNRSTIDWDENSRRLDEAQLLTTTAVVVGADRAIAAARSALGDEDLTTTTTFVQPAAMLPELRHRADDADLDIDDLRKATIAAVGAEEQELQTIRRFSVGNVVMWFLLAIVFYTMVGAIQQVGVQSIVDAISGATLSILLLALIIGQTPRFAGAVAVSQASPIPIPYGRLTLLEYAITFVNLAVPSTAARVAVNIRFFQRNGLDRTTAIGVGGLDSVAGFVAQISLMLVIVVFGLGSLDLNPSSPTTDFNGNLLIALVIALVVGVGIVALVPKFRIPTVAVIKTTWTKLKPLVDSPIRLVRVIAANLVVQLLFSLTSYTVLRAFGQDISFADVVLVNEGVALFSGLMPVPGGVGVTVSALTAGYTAMGVPSSTAMAAAMCYRIITFYVPPCFGYFAMKTLRRQRML